MIFLQDAISQTAFLLSVISGVQDHMSLPATTYDSTVALVLGSKKTLEALSKRNSLAIPSQCERRPKGRWLSRLSVSEN